MAGYDCHFHGGAQADDTVMLSGCDIGAGSRLRRVLMDKNCAIAPGTVMGWDEAADRARFPFVTDSGVIVLPKGTFVPVTGPIEFAFDMVELLTRDPATAETMRERTHTWQSASGDRHSDVAATLGL